MTLEGLKAALALACYGSAHQASVEDLGSGAAPIRFSEMHICLSRGCWPGTFDAVDYLVKQAGGEYQTDGFRNARFHHWWLPQKCLTT